MQGILRGDLQQMINDLKREHAELKNRLKVMYSKNYLSPKKQIEMKNLQKMKLKKKDAIAMLEAKL